MMTIDQAAIQYTCIMNESDVNFSTAIGSHSETVKLQNSVCEENRALSSISIILIQFFKNAFNKFYP